MKLSIQCWYNNRPAYFKGVDRLKQMWVLTDLEGKTYYLNHLERIAFKDHFRQGEMFNS